MRIFCKMSKHYLIILENNVSTPPPPKTSPYNAYSEFPHSRVLVCRQNVISAQCTAYCYNLVTMTIKYMFHTIILYILHEHFSTTRRRIIVIVLLYTRQFLYISCTAVVVVHKRSGRVQHYGRLFPVRSRYFIIFFSTKIYSRGTLV